MMSFQARSVVGGVFIKVLADKDLATKWPYFSWFGDFAPVAG
jgi:hypothetical protein